MLSRGYYLSFGTSLAKVGRDVCKDFYVRRISEQFIFDLFAVYLLV